MQIIPINIGRKKYEYEIGAVLAKIVPIIANTSVDSLITKKRSLKNDVRLILTFITLNSLYIC